MPAGDYTFCCSGCWGSGLFLTTVATEVAGVMPNLEAYYPFDDDTAADMSGNNRDGTWDQGTETYGEGIMGRAASFDGSSRIVVDAFANFAWGDQFTISLWFNRAGCDGNYQGIANGGGYHAEGSWEIRMGREGGCSSVGGGVVTASNGATWDHLGRLLGHEQGMAKCVQG